MPSLERWIPPLEIPRRTFALALLVAFAFGFTAAVWIIALLFR
jgi:hypothetical protein